MPWNMRGTLGSILQLGDVGWTMDGIQISHYLLLYSSTCNTYIGEDVTGQHLKFVNYCCRWTLMTRWGQYFVLIILQYGRSSTSGCRDSCESTGQIDHFHCCPIFPTHLRWLSFMLKLRGLLLALQGTSTTPIQVQTVSIYGFSLVDPF
jgi:hypothetical protein